VQIAEMMWSMLIAIHVPEEWMRQERNERNLPRIVETSGMIVIVLLAVAGVVGAIVAWSRKNFAVRTFLSFLSLLFGLNLIGIINGWPSLVAQFSTAQPFKTQVFIFIAVSLIGLLLLSFALALVIGFVQKWRRAPSAIETAKALIWGPALGALAAGVLALPAYFAPSLKPFWPLMMQPEIFTTYGCRLESLGQYLIKQRCCCWFLQGWIVSPMAGQKSRRYFRRY
jgi:hypothetical protein